jgi:hypothetical protein
MISSLLLTTPVILCLICPLLLINIFDYPILRRAFNFEAYLVISIPFIENVVHGVKKAKLQVLGHCRQLIVKEDMMFFNTFKALKDEV